MNKDIANLLKILKKQKFLQKTVIFPAVNAERRTSGFSGIAAYSLGALSGSPSVVCVFSRARAREAVLAARGRHDPCIVHRAVPVVEAVAALTILDTILTERS